MAKCVTVHCDLIDTFQHVQIDLSMLIRHYPICRKYYKISAVVF